MRGGVEQAWQACDRFAEAAAVNGHRFTEVASAEWAGVYKIEPSSYSAEPAAPGEEAIPREFPSS